MALVVSLDFELMWGVRDKQTLGSYGKNILGVREAIPAMLRMFRQYEVKATWAAVGMLLTRTKSELLDSLPTKRPNYRNHNLSPYQVDYFGQVGADEKSDPYHFGYSLAAQILDTPGMELATHTFSHYYCIEPGQMAEEFRADLEAAAAVSQRLGVTPRSIVFPRNQFNPEYLSICSQAGLHVYRGTESAWMYQPAAGRDPLAKRVARLADNYIDVSGPNSFRPAVDKRSGMTNAPASRFLRPYNRKLQALEPLRLGRITTAMTQAAKAGEHFHLWWHPHNFGANTQRNLQNLETVLRHHAKLRDSHGFTSCTMGELAVQ